MNWGKGIILGMALFMLFIILMCVKMFSLPADEYDHHYYEKGLNFDKDYAKERQVLADKAQPVIGTSGNAIQLRFKEEAQGTAKLVRPSSVSMDRSFAIKTNEDGAVALPLMHVAKGRWHIVLEWVSNHKNYLYEKEIDL